MNRRCSPRNWRCCCGMALAAALLIAGCSTKSRPGGYDGVAPGAGRDAELARRENGRAAALLDQGQLPEAEQLLKKALEADLMYGPAHNNMGKLYYKQGNLYQAAWEFQYAAKLMPYQPEPRNNLGLVFEAAGRLAEAIQSYDEALAMEPDNPQFLGNACRARLRRGDRDAVLHRMLRDLVLRDARPQWVQWAREQLARLGPAPSTQPTNEAGHGTH